MIRSIRRSTGVFLTLAVAVAYLTPTTEAKEPNPIVQLAKKLAQPVDFPGIDNPKTLQEALDLLTKQSGVRFDVNELAFQLEKGDALAAAGLASRRTGKQVYLVAAEDKQVPAKAAPPAKPAPFDPPDVENSGTGAETLVAIKPIRKMSHVRLETVLKKILERVPLLGRATYILRRDGIEITTERFKLHEFYRHRIPGDHTPLSPLGGENPEFFNSRSFYLPLVQAEFEKRPLEEAFRELADATDCSVILDERVRDKAKPVTATLINVPLDTAVELLANMVDLHVLSRDRTLYVTTKENIDAMQKELVERSEPGAINTGAPPSSPQANGKKAAPELPKTPPEFAKLQAEIAKLQAEIANLQTKKDVPKPAK